MARIKVTGYMETDGMNPEFVDLSHETGLSNKGYEAMSGASGEQFDYDLSSLDDLQTEVVEE